MTRTQQREIDPPNTDVRVPGPWAGPEEFDARLPAGYRLGSDGTHAAWLVTPHGQRLGLWVSPADEESPHLLLSARAVHAVATPRARRANHKPAAALAGRSSLSQLDE